MKRLSFLLLLAMSCFCADAQTKDSVPPYLKEPVIIPPFKILLADSTTFSKKDLPRKKFIVITYFNPECGHCQDEAEALSKNMAKFKNFLRDGGLQRHGPDQRIRQALWTG
jgi:thiol-disulfide isomerase/thioredoxin